MLGVSPSRISNLENGNVNPTLPEVCAFSLLFGHAFESHYTEIFDEMKAHMSAAYDDLPEGSEGRQMNFLRQNSLNKLYERLQEFDIDTYDG